MPRPPAVTQSEKSRVILQVLAGDITLVQAAHRCGVSPQAVANWRRQFVDAGSRALAPHCSDRVTPSMPSELQVKHLVREVTELKIALAEAHLALTGRHAMRVS
ncbi:transposase [Actinomycetes bacterium M1A6_2h]